MKACINIWRIFVFLLSKVVTISVLQSTNVAKTQAFKQAFGIPRDLSQVLTVCCRGSLDQQLLPRGEVLGSSLTTCCEKLFWPGLGTATPCPHVCRGDRMLWYHLQNGKSEVTQKLVIKNGLWLLSVSCLYSSLPSFVCLTSGIAVAH